MAANYSFVGSDFTNWDVMGEFIPGRYSLSSPVFRETEDPSEGHIATVRFDGYGRTVALRHDAVLLGMLSLDGNDVQEDEDSFEEWIQKVNHEITRIDHAAKAAKAS